MRRATIGQTVYHRWKCVNYDNPFCILVHSCFVESDDGQKVRLVDSNGCSTDRTIMPQLEYVGDLEVGQTSQACSFADRTQVSFQCQISVFPRNGECPAGPKEYDGHHATFYPTTADRLHVTWYGNGDVSESNDKLQITVYTLYNPIDNH
ncbi:unnamed protein product, partial [Mesorhabditis spiculigera]